MSTELRVRPLVAGTVGLRPLDPPLSTAAWYGDSPLQLAIPADWSALVHEPDPPPLDRDQMLAAQHGPVGAPPLASIATGARRVVIIVDDHTRPTPADTVLPLPLDDLECAGIDRANVTILVATGTHGPASADGMTRKVGPSAGGCRLVSHDDLAGCPKVGVTRMGTPVFVTGSSSPPTS